MITIVGYRSETESLSGTIRESTRGARGYSAYEIAVQEGYVGTEEEWLASLHGADGDPGPQGEQGIQGEPGTSVTAEVRQTQDGYEVTITDADGTHVFELFNGKDGTDGKDGKDGKDGQSGADGVSPQASVQQTSSGAIVTVEDASGITTAELTNGVSPSASVEQTSEGAIVTIQDASGTTTAVLTNGPAGPKGDTGDRGSKGDQGEKGDTGVKGDKGDKGDTGPKGDKGDKGDTGAKGDTGETGPQGPAGADGHTPVKGTDYWTAQDQQDIVDDVVEEVTKTVTVTGTTPTITGVANTRYICGEVTSLTITPPQSGIIDVLFTSGSTKTVLTLPNTVQMPSGFDTEANTVYEISIMDGVYGLYASWEVVS